MQSCDICRKRKVKCDRRTPCARCRRLRQPCTYTDILRKKGPKFVHTYPSIYTSGPTSGSISASGSGDSLGVYENELSGIEGMAEGSASRGGDGTGTGTRTGSEVGSELEMEVDLELDLELELEGLPHTQKQFAESQGYHDGGKNAVPIFDGDILSLYEESLHPLYPIIDLHEMRLEFQLGYTHSSARYAMICSLSAAVHAHFASASLEGESEHKMTCERFLRDAIQARAELDMAATHPDRRGDHTDLERNRDKILSSFFLFVGYWNSQRERHAWWYLRECIALLFSCHLHREDEYRKLEPREAECRRRIFWGVFVAERTFCILHDKPITLRPWIELPRLPTAFTESGVIAGFMRLVTMFQGVNVDLSGCWTAAGFVTPVTLSLASALPVQYDDIEAGIPIQRLDLAITREWLRARAWNLGIPRRQSSAEFVASSENAHWRLDEPVFIGKAILGDLQNLSDVLEGSWSRILDQKLCDICACLYDVKQVMQTRGQAGEFDLDQILHGLLEVLTRFRVRSAYLLSHACAGITLRK
ncbi:hypothetical protein BJX70DRAFT_375229 [Aspergillus crustosus]